jgi:hypothetical protein
MRRNLILLAFVLVLLAIPLLTLVQWKREMHREFERDFATINLFYEELSAQRLALLHAVVDQVALREDVQKSLRAGDREALLGLMQPVIKHLAAEHGVTLLYFHDAAGQTLLRVHQPTLAPEKLNRYLLTAAQRSGGVASGLEMGSHGLLSLRVVYPMVTDGALIGFVELGEDIDQVVTQLQKLTGVKLLMTVKKEYVSREGWETGLQFTGRKNSWDLLPDSVIPHSYIRHFSPELLEHVARQRSVSDDAFHFYFEETHYAGRVFPLRDTIRSVVGDLLILRDVSTEVQRGHLVVLASCAFSVLLAGLGWLLVRQRGAG